MKFPVYLVPFVFLLSCSNSADQKRYEISVPDKDTIRFKGKINPESATELIEKIRSANSGGTLIVTSGGGSGASGLRIAKAMQKKKFNIRVVGHCASGCASYLFVAANRKFVEPDSVVLFHTSTHGDEDAISRSDLTSYDSFTQSNLENEISLYKAANVSIQILTKADEILVLQCVDYKQPRSEKSPEKLVIGWAFHFWTVSREQLDRLGIKDVQGYWPKNLKELQRAVKKSIGRKDYSMAFVNNIDLVIPLDQKIPRCYPSKDR
ncbi:MAG: hypothetical protein V3V15_02990 [Sphingorhabdus sp.]